MENIAKDIALETRRIHLQEIQDRDLTRSSNGEILKNSKYFFTAMKRK